MILSAGYGTRLWPLTEDRTKPAIPILGKPLVGYVAEYLASNGCRDIVVNLHHQPESVRRALGDGSQFGVQLEYVFEPTILGTSGALDNAKELLQDDTFLVVNGKIITDIDLQAAIETHRRANAIATMVLLPNPKCERFSVVNAEDGILTGFGGMPRSEEFTPDCPPLMFTGIHVMEPRIFDYIPRGVFSDSVIDVYPKAMANGERIAVHVSNDNWYELSTMQRYLEISLMLLRKEGRNVFAGERANISPSANLRDSILWDGVSVGDGARVSRAIVADNVSIGTGEVIENAAVVSAELVRDRIPPAKALKGEFRGSNFVVPLAE